MDVRFINWAKHPSRRRTRTSSSPGSTSLYTPSYSAIMAPSGTTGELSAKRAQFAGPTGLKGLLATSKTSSIACFAALGGFVYGYNQGMFGQILTMQSFANRLEPFYSLDTNSSTGTATERGLLTAILELGAWIGVLFNGWLADAVGRRVATVIAAAVFTLGVIVQACTQPHGKDYILAGRFVTGLGVGAFSLLVPLYNAELAPPETRGALVALQQLAITFGIMISYCKSGIFEKPSEHAC